MSSLYTFPASIFGKKKAVTWRKKTFWLNVVFIKGTTLLFASLVKYCLCGLIKWHNSSQRDLIIWYNFHLALRELDVAAHSVKNKNKNKNMSVGEFWTSRTYIDDEKTFRFHFSRHSKCTHPSVKCHTDARHIIRSKWPYGHNILKQVLKLKETVHLPNMWF